MHQLTILLLAALVAIPSAGRAQPAEQAAPAAAVDASKLGVDLSRIKRELKQADEQEAGDSPLRLRFTVQVVGIAPKIDFLEGFSLTGAIPYGAPTHQEVLDVLTPKEFRSPVFPIYSLAALAAQKFSQYNKKKQCEAEIEEYRRLVMQGVPIAAPRCTQ